MDRVTGEQVGAGVMTLLPSSFPFILSLRLTTLTCSQLAPFYVVVGMVLASMIVLAVTWGDCSVNLSLWLLVGLCVTGAFLAIAGFHIWGNVPLPGGGGGRATRSHAFMPSDDMHEEASTSLPPLEPSGVADEESVGQIEIDHIAHEEGGRYGPFSSSVREGGVHRSKFLGRLAILSQLFASVWSLWGLYLYLVMKGDACNPLLRHWVLVLSLLGCISSFLACIYCIFSTSLYLSTIQYHPRLWSGSGSYSREGESSSMSSPSFF
jgi:hypothetical protein